MAKEALLAPLAPQHNSMMASSLALGSSAARHLPAVLEPLHRLVQLADQGGHHLVGGVTQEHCNRFIDEQTRRLRPDAEGRAPPTQVPPVVFKVTPYACRIGLIGWK
ncbi:hypothetical protein GCM10010252_73610 [Streptomyces aureoverticillatus]|nr:hypothetical protein GCM10010252_73610 [Streptomyces aureoverticillatus]